MTIVIASDYVLFAVMEASSRTLVLESLVGVVFYCLPGFRSSLWLVVTARAAGGVFDLVHGFAIPNPRVPPWWPAFCLGYGVTAALYLAWLLRTGQIRATA